MLRRLCFVLAALTFAGCETPPTPGVPPSKKDPAEADNPAADKPLGEVAPQLAIAAPLLRPQLAAPLTLAIHPARWAALHGALLPLLAKLPDELEPLRKATTPQAGSELAASVLGLAPPKLEGWDTSRPILIAIGETDYAGVAGATVAQMPLDEGWVPGVRHQVFIPATDHAALLKSLTAFFSSGSEPLPGLAKGRADAAAMRIEGHSVVLLPGRKGVRVVVFSEYVGLAPDKAIAHMSKRLDAPIHVTNSAAANMLKDDGAALAAWFRPDRLRPAGLSYGAAQMFEALEHASADAKQRVAAAGTGTLMTADAVMVDEGAEVDEIGMALVVDGGALRVRQVVSLSEEGEQAFAAATKDVAKTFAGAADPVWADLVVRANIRALLNAVDPPPFANEGGDQDALVQAIYEGGYFATLHMGTRHGLGLLRLAERAAGPFPFPTDTIPTAAHVRWSGMSGTGFGDLPKLAVALHWPAGHDISEWTGLLEGLGRESGLRSLNVLATEYEGAPTHVMGLGGLSKTAFAMDKPSSADPLLELRVNVPALARAAAAIEPGLELPFAETSQLHVTMRHHSHALVSELAWSPAGGEVEAKPVPVPKATGAQEPLGSPATAEPDRCVGTAAFAYAGMLRAVSYATPESLDAIVNKALGEADKAVTCASVSPKAKVAVHGLRRIALTALLEALADPKLKASIRKQQCAELKDAPFCSSVDATP